MSEQAATAKFLYEQGSKYAQMCAALNCCDRHLRRLLAEAGITRNVGRPRNPLRRKVISLEAAGLA